MRASIVVAIVAGSLLAASMTLLSNQRSSSLVNWLTGRSGAPAIPDLGTLAASPTSNQGRRGQSPDPDPPETHVLPAGSIIRGLLQGPIHTRTSRPGDIFTLSVIEPVIENGRMAVPRGASVHGVVNEVRPATDSGRPALLTLTYKSVTDVRGRMHPIKARPLRTIDLVAASSSQSGPTGDYELLRGQILEVRLEAPLTVPLEPKRQTSQVSSAASVSESERAELRRFPAAP